MKQETQLNSLMQRARERGAEEEYLNWLRRWPSVFTETYSEYKDGEGLNPACHVRRVSMGAGMGEKPPYFAVPMHQEEHSMQHQKGEGIYCPPQWWECEAIRYLCLWINGVQPPELEEQKARWRKTFIIEHPGQLVAHWQMLKRYFKNPKAPKVKMTLERAVQRRSNQQNKAQWGVIYAQAIAFYKQRPDRFVSDVLKVILVCLNNDFVHRMFKAMFLNGKSTASLSKLESNKYMDDIREYFLNEHQHIISEPINPNEDLQQYERS